MSINEQLTDSTAPAIPKITLLDCTFRDGGYYTNWEFDHELSMNYLNLCGQVGIDVIELGYLRFSPTKAGPYGNLPHQLSSELATSIQKFSHLKIAAMIEAKDLVHIDAQLIGQEINNRLANAVIPITMLRIAVHYSQTHILQAYIPQIQASGYEVCINIMQIDMATTSQLEQCISDLKHLEHIVAVYLADSLGSLNPERVRHVTKHFVKSLNCPIGFHAHDNRGLALHNSLVALEAGATWIDSTINGMGRGAGNAKTEQLLSIVHPQLTHQQQVELYSFSAQFFYQIHSQYGWGASALYGISGIHKIHPTYAQLLHANKNLNVKEKINILSSLSSLNASAYQKEVLDEAMNAYA